MKCNSGMLRLYAVTDRRGEDSRTLLARTEAAIQNGVSCVQLREKELSEEAFLREALSFRELCSRYGVPLVINDNVEVAICCGADGIHIGQQDMALSEARRRVGDTMIIGVTAHTVEEAKKAEDGGADYLGLGAVFPTSTKTGTIPMTQETLRAICAAVSIPKVAIGGISEENILRLSGSGVDGVAVVSAIYGAPDPGSAAARLRKLAETIIAP